MESFTLSYYSATSTEIPSLSQGVEQFSNDLSGSVRVHAKTQVQLFDKSRIDSFVKQSLKADIIIITLHGGKESCPALDPLIEALKNPRNIWFHIQPSVSDEDAMEFAREHSTGFGTPAWDRINAYLKNGGPINFKNLFFFVHELLTEVKSRKPEELDMKSLESFKAILPVPLPHDGIYHPDFPDIPKFEDYYKEKIKQDRITIGIWFYQTYWVNNNFHFINALIRTAEKMNVNVIPVFHMRWKDKVLGNDGADKVAEKYFMKDGEPIIDVLVNPMMFSLTLAHPSYKDIYPDLNVPVIQAMMTMQPHESWKESIQGLTTMEVSFAAAQPEFDGSLITVPIASRQMDETDPLTGALIARYMPINDRVELAINIAINWAKLSKKKNKDKKVAIIFHHYPPRNDRIGCAAGLDSFESVKEIVDELKQSGYTLEKTYKNGDEISHKIISRMTCDQRWLLPEQMYEKCVATAKSSDYMPWHEELPPAIKEKQAEDWGQMPGDLFVYNDEMMFAGFKNGNIFISVQPPRGYYENIDKIYHDMYLSPPHHYLAQYRYIKYVFKADAVIHVGKHGSLEWLPGKALGLSEECYPALSIMDLPNIYPYIINDPGEGTQAKRRSYACIIDHLTPAFTNADLYEDLSKVENHIKEYLDAKREDPGKLSVLKPMIWEGVIEADLDKDLEITKEQAFDDFDTFLENLHAYLSDLGDTMINDGLHTFGIVPPPDRLKEFLVQLTRVANGNIPSLRESIVKQMGFDYDHLLENRGKVVDTINNFTGAEIIKQAHGLGLKLVDRIADINEDIPELSLIKIQEIILQVIPNADRPDGTRVDIGDTCFYIANSIIPNIKKTPEEIKSTLTALNGGFVLPGPSGAPTRGEADILPTGRNFYSVDPNKIPSPAAWKVGKALGDALLERYMQETKKYPESVGIIVFGTSTMRSKGDDIAEVFYLLGVKPVWHKTNGMVLGLEIIPLKELGRPRIDVMPRISGFFRDSFPLLVERIDEAVRMVAALDEPLESNLIRRHVLRDMEDYEADGQTKDQAFREATFRVFGCPPGTYGAGVKELVESKNWKTQEDLGNNYIRYTSHAYGEGSYGIQKPAVFRTLLARMDVTVKNEDSREYDMMSCTDYYNYYGGLIVAGKSVTGKLPFSYMGDSADPERVKIRSTNEEAKHVLRSRLVNPKWLKGMMRHGYKGAGDISHMMDVALGWDATAEVIDDWMYESLARAYVLDEKMKKWMNEVNPYARQNILDKLLEAISRGMWKADPDMEEQLKEEYLEIEGEIEGITE